MAGLAGKNLRFQLASGPFNVKVTECNSNLRTDWPETSNSESLGFEEFVSNFFGGDIDIVVVGQIADTPYTKLGNGQSVSVLFYPDKATTGSNIAGTLSIHSWQSRGQVKDTWKVHVTGKLNGIYSVSGL